MSRKIGISKIKDIVENQGGVLLTNEYNDVKTKLKIKCSKNHIWDTTYDSIRKGSWCSVCAGNNKKSMMHAQEIASNKKGKCIGGKYINNKSKLLWQCEIGHIWSASYAEIISNRWCPYCSSGLYEKICRLYFETIFGKSFVKTRPSWLINENGNRLELDGYCIELGIAFEHNGMQHYRDVEWFGGDCNKQKEHDLIKKKICYDRGISLIIIPSLQEKIKISDLKLFIKNECLNIGIKLPKDYDDINIDFSCIYSQEFMNIKKDIKNAYNVNCLSDFYAGSSFKLKWQCECGYKWKEDLANIKHKLVKNKDICKMCRIKNYKIKKFYEILKISQSHGGKCLSEYYIRSDKYMLFQCKNGHIWQALPANIKRGNWCQKCHLESLCE